MIYVDMGGNLGQRRLVSMFLSVLLKLISAAATSSLPGPPPNRSVSVSLHILYWASVFRTRFPSRLYPNSKERGVSAKLLPAGRDLSKSYFCNLTIQS